MPATQPKPPPIRLVAYVIWGSLLLGVLMMTGVAAFVGPGIRAAQHEPLPGALPFAAALINVVLLAGSRFIPRVLKPETPALSKNIVATAVCEGGALFGAIAWMLTGSGQALAGLIIGLGGIAACFPRDSRWRVLGGVVEGDLLGGDRSSGAGFGRSDR
jgi:hypothetical protein